MNNNYISMFYNYISMFLVILGLSLVLAPMVTATRTIYVVDGNPTCEDLSESPYNCGPNEVKFDTDDGDLYDGNTKGPITLDDVIDDYSFDWSSTLGVDCVLAKAASDNHNLYTYVPDSFGDTGLESNNQDHAISHLLFCYNLDSSTTTSTTPTTIPIPEFPSGAASVIPGVIAIGGYLAIRRLKR
jgi:hypothetical protein